MAEPGDFLCLAVGIALLVAPAVGRARITVRVCRAWGAPLTLRAFLPSIGVAALTLIPPIGVWLVLPDVGPVAPIAVGGAAFVITAVSVMRIFLEGADRERAWADVGRGVAVPEALLWMERDVARRRARGGKGNDDAEQHAMLDVIVLVSVLRFDLADAHLQATGLRATKSPVRGAFVRAVRALRVCEERGAARAIAVLGELPPDAAGGSVPLELASGVRALLLALAGTPDAAAAAARSGDLEVTAAMRGSARAHALASQGDLDAAREALASTLGAAAIAERLPGPATRLIGPRSPYRGA
jgi:hypothetical protein